MNIKPPIFSNLPSQVSPEWRWFWSSVPSLATNHENLFNYGTGENLILINSPIVTVGSLGRGYETLYSDLDAFRAGQGYDLSSGKDWTFVCVRKGTASSTTIGFDHDDAVIVGKGDYDTNPSYALRESVGSGLTNLIWKWFGGTITGTENIANQNWITPRPTRVIGAKNYAGGSLSLWLDGQEIGNGSWSQSDPDDDLILGANETDTPTITLAGTHRWYATYIFPVVLTDGQMRQLAEDPFGPFRQANRLFLPDLPRSFGSVVVPSDTQRQPITVQSSGPTDINISQQPELITNGGFDADSDWTKGTGWSISDGVATHAIGSNLDLSQTLSGKFSYGKTYRIQYDIVNVLSGQVRSTFAGSTGTFNSTVGTFIDYLVPPGPSGTLVNFDPSTDFSGSIDNVSVREINIKITP